MDHIGQRIRVSRGLPGRTAPAAAAFVLMGTLLGAVQPAEAQNVRLNATGGPIQQLAHNGQNAFQVFPEVKWVVVNPQGRDGAVVALTCAAFSSTLDSRSQADVQLDLRVIRAPGRGDWRVDKATDVSDVDAGRGSADVVASSTRRGNAQLGIVVTFANDDLTLLLPSDYETTLVGTITAN